MEKKPKMKITKLDAARRQLETAIRLYFNDADPVSIHTLAGAAHNILSDLNNKYGGNPMIVSDFMVKDEHKVEIRKLINEAKNHFKHANKDPEVSIDFRPEVNDYVLFDSCEKYIELTSEKILYFIIFRGWFTYTHPGVLVYPNTSDEKIKESMQIYRGNKANYFASMLSASAHLK
ncbi:MAG: hypothetical protein ABSB79_13030 [Syntrophales bacterium]